MARTFTMLQCLCTSLGWGALALFVGYSAKAGNISWLTDSLFTWVVFGLMSMLSFLNLLVFVGYVIRLDES